MADDRRHTTVMAAEGGRTSSTFKTSELKALALYGKGLPDDEIAGRLGISQTTACQHIENARRRLGVSTRQEAFVIATRLELFKLT